jgi:thiosulfate dehydrogenase [quinone] large subunit
MPPLSPSGQRIERALLFAIRVCIGWTFLWAAIHTYGNDTYVAGFLSHTKTFQPIYGPLAQSSALPVIGFMVEYGHLLIGLSLVFGLGVRASAPFGMLLLLLYWTAHMNFPYIETANFFMIDYHVVFFFAIALLMLRHAGHAYGLDGVVAKWRLVQDSPALHWLTV